MLSAALGPPPVFIGSENVMAMPKSSALAKLTEGAAVSAVAVVVNVVVEWLARALFARSLTPDAPPTTTNEYPVLAVSGVEGTKFTERLFGLYETPPATALLLFNVSTSFTVVVVS